jgi:hypothetical protein
MDPHPFKHSPPSSPNLIPHPTYFPSLTFFAVSGSILSIDLRFSSQVDYSLEKQKQDLFAKELTDLPEKLLD